MKKRGSSALATPIMIGISIIILSVLFVLVINLITPFILYLKIENIATKYIFVIEKFGYLTEIEKNNMLNELNSQGISSNYVTVECPNKKEPYGNLISLSINYEYQYNIPGFSNDQKERKTMISVKKNSFSKIY